MYFRFKISCYSNKHPENLAMNNRKCLQCNEQLRGRADQKFCNDQCRSSYNNSQYLNTGTVIKTVNRILKKNYSILAALNANGKTTAKRSDLQKKGYCFDYFTFTTTTRSSRINYYCYDQGYREQEHDKLILVRFDQSNNRISPGA